MSARLAKAAARLLGIGLAIAVVPASAAPGEDPKQQQALEDDILLVIDLPLVAYDAREAGLEPEDVADAISVAREAGLSAGEAAEIVDAEVVATKERGVKLRLGPWLRQQVAAGNSVDAIAKATAKRAEGEALDDAKLAKLTAKLAAHKAKHEARRAKLVAKRAAMIAKGKAPKLVWKEAHDEHEAALKAQRKALIAARRLLGPKAELRAARRRLVRAHKAWHRAAEADKAAAQKTVDAAVAAFETLLKAHGIPVDPALAEARMTARAAADPKNTGLDAALGPAGDANKADADAKEAADDAKKAAGDAKKAAGDAQKAASDGKPGKAKKDAAKAQKDAAKAAKEAAKAAKGGEG